MSPTPTPSSSSQPRADATVAPPLNHADDAPVTPPAGAAEHVAGATADARATRARIWGLASAVAVVLGSIGPWASWGPVTVHGLDADGVITLPLGLAALAAVATRRVPIALLVVAVVTTLIGIADTDDVSSGNAIFDPSPGWGVILTAAAGASLTAFAGRTLLVRRGRRGA